MLAPELGARVTRLTIYPVKGLAGQPCMTVDVQERGFAWDRRWMLVDENRRFLSQRQLPRMATIKPRVNDRQLVLSHESTHFCVPVQPPTMAPKVQVTIWRDEVEAAYVPEAGQWVSEILGIQCELVYMPETTRRPVNPNFASPDDIVGFADAYPALLIGEASLADLNARLDVPVPMDRFRPNIVVSTRDPFEEDQWGELEVGSVLLRGAKACDRCAVPTVDQVTGERTGPEPIRTLASYRRFGDGVYIGQNFTVRRPGKISVNDRVMVKERIAAVYA